MDADVPTTKRQAYRKRLEGLKQIQSRGWREKWRILGENIQPTRTRLLVTDENRGDDVHTHIINSTPIGASDTAAAGLMAGFSSPARPWFELGTPDPELSEVGPVRMWLNQVARLILYALAKGGVYKSMHEAYLDAATFGTAAMYIEAHPTRLLRAETFPIGSYYLATGPDGRVNTLYRELTYSVAELVEEFGIEKCSKKVKTHHENKRYDEPVQCCHVIEPNAGVKPGRMGPEGMPWTSCWFEVDTPEDEDAMLRTGGYEEFPVMAPRWATTGRDVYGRSPGWAALGDCLALQLYEKRKAQAVEKTVSPPMGAPTNMHGTLSLLPGAVTRFDALSAGQRIQPLVEIDPAAIVAASGEIAIIERRINDRFGASLWTLVAQGQTNPTKTATEIIALEKEKMLQLGPVGENLSLEFHDPLINRVFGILLRDGYIPEPPEELSGMDLKVEYISPMAQAQKMIGIGAIDKLVTSVTTMAAADLSVLDKLDLDQVVDEVAGMLGVPPAIVRSDDQVAEIREKRSQAQAAAKEMERAAQLAEGAKTLSETSTEGQTALTELIGQRGPAAAGLQ